MGSWWPHNILHYSWRSQETKQSLETHCWPGSHQRFAGIWGTWRQVHFIPFNGLYLSHDRHSSVSGGYGVALWVIILVQRRVWLESPMREWQSLPHLAQVKSIASRSAWSRAFLLWRFASACCVSDCSKLDRPFCTVCCQAVRSEAAASHVARSTSMAFKFLLQTSLYRSWGLPVGRLPCASSP